MVPYSRSQGDTSTIISYTSIFVTKETESLSSLSPGTDTAVIYYTISPLLCLRD